MKRPMSLNMNKRNTSVENVSHVKANFVRYSGIKNSFV